jgi:hypothetical protein
VEQENQWFRFSWLQPLQDHCNLLILQNASTTALRYSAGKYIDCVGVSIAHCINCANLATAQSQKRRKEVVTRRGSVREADRATVSIHHGNYRRLIGVIYRLLLPLFNYIVEKKYCSLTPFLDWQLIAGSDHNCWISVAGSYPALMLSFSAFVVRSERRLGCLRFVGSEKFSGFTTALYHSNHRNVRFYRNCSSFKPYRL